MPKGRPRFTRSGHVYTPKATKQYEQKVATHLLAQGAKPTDKAIRFTAVIVRPYLKSWTKKQLEEAKQGKAYPITRPDLDNYLKAILDASNGVLFFDDSQICSLGDSRKEYGEEEQVIIEIEELN